MLLTGNVNFDIFLQDGLSARFTGLVMTIRQSLLGGPPMPNEYTTFIADCMRLHHVEYTAEHVLNGGKYSFDLQLKVIPVMLLFCFDFWRK